LPYYLGLEDDYQVGFHFAREKEGWRLNGAYFLLEESRGTSEVSLVYFLLQGIPTMLSNSNIERYQLNLRVAKEWSGSALRLSLHRDALYNLQTGHLGSNFAAAFHHEGNMGPWNIKAEVIYYACNDASEVLDVVQMGAYGFGTYDVANRGVLYVSGLSYGISDDWVPVRNIQLYNDYTLMQKFTEGNGTPSFKYRKSQQNGFCTLFAAGQVYACFDVAMG
jgi:hypothetical protein